MLCCDATLVSPLMRTGQPQPCTANVDGTTLRTAERRKGSHLPEAPGRRAAEARRVWQRGRRALPQRCAAFGARPASTTVLQSSAGPTAVAASGWVGHSVCRSAAGGCQHGPRPSPRTPPAWRAHARPRARPRRGRGAEPPAAATLVVVVACSTGLGLP